MTNQGGDTIPGLDSNSFEKHQVSEAGQGHASTYGHAYFSPPATAVSKTLAWNSYRTDNGSTENGFASNSGYHYDQQTEVSRDVRGLTSTSNSSTQSTLGAANGLQESSAYVSYPTSTDPHGYGNTAYPNYPAYGYPPQTNPSYPQQVGSYPTSGAPYQSHPSFQITSSYGPSTSYSSTHYNAAADYQTTGGYQSSGYDNQTNMWYDYGNYPYPNYQSSDSVGAHSSSNVAATPVQYQPHYQQWTNNFSSTASDVSCAPGTENISVTTASTLNCAVPGIGGGYPGYPASNSQPPPPGTTSWRPSSSSSEIPSLQQASTAIVDNCDGSWKVGAPGFQNNNLNQMPPSYQKALDSNPLSYENFEDQQKTLFPQAPNLQYPSTHQAPNLQFPTSHQAPNIQFPTAHQAPNLQFPTAHQVPQNFQSPLQTGPALDTRRVSKLQIPTNPRIASTLAFGMSKTEKDSSTTDAASKPAYISVSMPQSNNKVSSHNAANTMPMPETFPKSFCAYVERALARCKDDVENVMCQNIMKEMTTKAMADGTLFTRNWDIEPLFPIPNTSVDSLSKDNSQSSAIGSSLPKYKRSPSRRSKSRWEPIPEEKLAEKLASVNYDPVKDVRWDRLRERERTASSGKHEIKEGTSSEMKFISSKEQNLSSKNGQRHVKRRLNDGISTTESGDVSSESDKEQGLTAYYSGAIALANSPEERKRRENRSKRFDKGREHRAEIKYFRPKGGVGAGNLYSRTSAPSLSKDYEDGCSRAVEDMDWDALTVKGTCQEIEKRYLRLTSAPDPATVRPEEVLEKALSMVQSSQKNYFYKCDQLKSIRQDLTVQRIHNELTVKVYETHARFAMEAGDLPEYNQCQSQLKSLYAEGIKGCHLEFSAYNLLCVIMHSNNNRDLLASMARLSAEAKKNEAVKHALAVRAAVTSGNYIRFFRLYKTAPNLNTCLMDLYVEKMRFEAVRCMSRSYRPTVPTTFIAQVLGFTSIMPMEGSDEKDTDGLEECDEWLRAHGASIIVDSNGERQLDTKVSSSSLYMPEPEDAVAHGDTSLAVNDFLTRTS